MPGLAWAELVTKLEGIFFVCGVMLREAVSFSYPHFVEFARKYNKIGGFSMLPGLAWAELVTKLEGIFFVRGVMLCEAVSFPISTFVDLARKYNELASCPDFAHAGADLRGARLVTKLDKIFFVRGVMLYEAVSFPISTFVDFARKYNEIAS